MINYGFTKEIDISFDEAVEIVIQALKKEGFGVLTKIDLKEKFKDKILEFSKSKKYKIIGLPFYNSESENDFKEKLFDSIKV